MIDIEYAPATVAAHERRYCTQPAPTPIVLPPGLATPRVSAITLVAKKWVNGTLLQFHFLQGAGWNWPEVQKQAVRAAFAKWKSLGIGLDFAETNDPGEAEIRIGFAQGDGSWSYVGTDNLQIHNGERTMNFGWDLTTVWGAATALHEIGHAMGMHHEHLSPKSGIVWNEDAVLARFAASPNFWPREQIVQNILAKLTLAEVEGSDWDVHSIMHYPFEPGMIAEPPPFDVQGTPQNTTPSPNDIAWIQRFYPTGQVAHPIGVMDFQPIAAITGGQADFVIVPAATRDYVVRTIGASDCKIVVFVERGGVPRFLTGEDDSGTSDNAAVTVRLVKDERYFIRVRTHFADTSSGLGLIVV